MMRDSLRTSRLAGLGASCFFFTFFESFLFFPFWLSTPEVCAVWRVCVVRVRRVIQLDQVARGGACERCRTLFVFFVLVAVEEAREAVGFEKVEDRMLDLVEHVRIRSGQRRVQLPLLVVRDVYLSCLHSFVSTQGR